jgi:hypothetical protein
MARRPAHTITLDLAGEHISADRFRRAVDAFFDLIAEVSKEVTGEPSSVRWFVSVEKGSIHLSAAPQAINPTVPVKRIAQAIRSGVSLIEHRAKRPRFFTDAALVNAKTLALVADGREIRKAQVRATPRPVALTEKTANHVDAILRTKYIEDYGTIEGQLRIVSAQNGYHFTVYDPVTERGIRCRIAEERIDEAIRAFRKRVIVSGLIHYRSDGEPISIDVEDFILLESQPAAADEVYGILTSG